MLKIDSLILADEDAKEKAPLQDLFGKGISVLPFEKKDEFLALSLSFSEIRSGSLAVDDCLLVGDNANKLSIFELDVMVNGIASLTAVFFTKKSQKDLFLLERAVSKELKEAKSLPILTEEEKKAKLSKVIDVLSAHGVSYLLFDLNESPNSENEALVRYALSPKKGTFVFLSKAPASLLAKKPSPGFFQGLLDEGKKVNLLRISLFAASFLDGLCFVFSGVLLKNGQPALGAFLLLAALLLFAVDFLLGALAYKIRPLRKKSASSFFSFETINFFINLVGVALSYLLAYFLAAKGILLTEGTLKGLPQVLIILFGALLLFAPYFGKAISETRWFEKLCHRFHLL